MRNPLLEQDLARALWLLEYRIDDVDSIVKYWAAFKARQKFCPDIEKIEGDVWTKIF